MATISLQADPKDPHDAIAEGGSIGTFGGRTVLFIYDDTKVLKGDARTVLLRLKERMVEKLSARSH